MDLKQITQNLNEEFGKSCGRKLIFWYDADAEFVDDVDAIELENAKIYKLEKDNLFYTKYFLECEDTTTNYLIYAPFIKPDVRDDHLADTVRYSKEFFADKPSLICVDLGIPSQLKAVVEKHKKFFNAAARYSKFTELCIEKYDEKMILIGMMSVICKSKTAIFEEVLRTVLMGNTETDNKYMSELEKYDLAEPFWSLCDEHYGYKDSSPSLDRLAFAFFITYTGYFMNGELPTPWKNNTAIKVGSVVAFMDNTMNNTYHREVYDELSSRVALEINAKKHLSSMPLEKLIECDSFEVIDELIIDWIKDNLISENIKASLSGHEIPDVISIRGRKHYADKFSNIYGMLDHAYEIVKVCNYSCPVKLNELIDHYKDVGSLIDSHYRMFYWYFDKIEKTTPFESLRERVENIYTNEYLDKITISFTDALLKEKAPDHILLQRNFYRQFVAPSKERLVVIISDAFRYELARSLCLKLEDDEKCHAKSFMMLGVLPSITKVGMASLLPHKNIQITDDFKVLVDGMPCETTPQRDAVLKSEDPDNVALLFNDVAKAKRDEIREMFTSKNVIYLYHNQIDARGDNQATENEVFDACSEAVEEIHKMVRRLTEVVSATHFIITSDHGFIYKHDKIQEYDKIEGLGSKGVYAAKRFIFSPNPIDADGVRNYKLSDYIGGSGTEIVAVPAGANIFKMAGGGQNYVHGGASPQEMLIPVVDIRTVKGHQETSTVGISLISTTSKVTGLVQSFEFFQSEPVSDVVKGAKYRIYFVSADGEPISNEVIYEADSKEEDSAKRLIKLKFTFKNRKYDNSKKYYLVAYLEPKKDYQEPTLKHQFIIDIAFADDFGF